MRRDVTVLLSVDEDRVDAEDSIQAWQLIQLDRAAVVADDATAVAVLELLGLSRSKAIERVRRSYGLPTDRLDPRVRHLRELEMTSVAAFEIPDSWADLSDAERDRIADSMLKRLWEQLDRQPGSPS